MTRMKHLGSVALLMLLCVRFAAAELCTGKPLPSWLVHGRHD